MAERMLIIDDEEIVLNSCRRIFAEQGFNVVTTTRLRFTIRGDSRRLEDAGL